MSQATKLAGAAGDSDPDIGLRAVAALRKLVEQLETLQVRNARRVGWSFLVHHTDRPAAEICSSPSRFRTVSVTRARGMPAIDPAMPALPADTENSARNTPNPAPRTCARTTAAEQIKYAAARVAAEDRT